MILRVALLGALALLVGACQPRSVPLLATAEYEQEVRKIAAPPSDRARLYIFTGTMQRYAVWTAVGTCGPGNRLTAAVRRRAARRAKQATQACCSRAGRDFYPVSG